MEEKIKTLSTLSAKHFRVSLDAVRLSTGRVAERIRVDHPEAAAVVPFLDEDRMVMVRQWRYAVGRESLEIPAGKVDPGEDPAACARRELTEETGYHAARLVPLFQYYPAIGYSNERIHIFAAGGLQQSTVEPDISEIAKVEIISLREVRERIAGGLVQDGKTVIGLALFETKRERGEIPDGFFQGV
jgi:ADP-ribose pyrophosphatase